MSIIYPNNGSAGGGVYHGVIPNIGSGGGGSIGGGYVGNLGMYPQITTGIPSWNNGYTIDNTTDAELLESLLNSAKTVFDAKELKKKFSGIAFNPKATLYYLTEIDVSKAVLKFCNFWEDLVDYTDYGVSLDKECVAFNSEETRDNFKRNWNRYLDFYRNSNITSDYPNIHFDYNGTYISDHEGISLKDEWRWIFLSIEKTAKREKSGWVFEELSDAVAFKMWRG